MSGGADAENFDEPSLTQTLRSRMSDGKHTSKKKIQVARHSEQVNMHRTIGALTPLNPLSGGINARHLKDFTAPDGRAHPTVAPYALGKKASKAHAAARRPQHSPPQRYQSVDKSRQRTPVIVPALNPGKATFGVPSDNITTPASRHHGLAPGHRGQPASTATPLTAVTPKDHAAMRMSKMPKINESSGQDLSLPQSAVRPPSEPVAE